MVKQDVTKTVRTGDDRRIAERGIHGPKRTSLCPYSPSLGQLGFDDAQTLHLGEVAFVECS